MADGGEHPGPVPLPGRPRDVAADPSERVIRLAASLLRLTLVAEALPGLLFRAPAPARAGGEEGEDDGCERSHPKKARATSYHSGGTVFSSAVASASDTSTIVSPCSAAMRPKRPSWTRSAAFSP